MHVLSNHHVQMGTAEDKTHGTSNSAENDVEGGISVTSCLIQSHTASMMLLPGTAIVGV